MPYLHSISVTRFRSLRSVELPLRELNVLVGPNSAGKSNLLNVIQFLGDVARNDLFPAIEDHGGFSRLLFRGAHRDPHSRRRGGLKRLSEPSIEISVSAQVTEFASPNALDEYSLSFWSRDFPLSGETRVGDGPTARSLLQRKESFRFKRTKGRGRRITVEGQDLEFHDQGRKERRGRMSETSAALSTLPRLSEDEGATQVQALADLFTSFRVFDVDVKKCRRPSEVRSASTLAPDAGNLSAYLRWLKESREDVFSQLEGDLRHIVPGFEALWFEEVGGASQAIVVGLVEKGLQGWTPLADASFGTIRALALLAMLHDPAPPKLTCVEEIDHGLHPYALDRIIERLREASGRTQFLVATHSPAFVSRLDPAELVVCERDDETGESRIPAIDPQEVLAMTKEGTLNLGELWFSGALGGVP